MNLPIEYRWLKAHNFNLLTPWYFVEPTDSSNGLRREYQIETGLDMIPFARRQDNDDIAGFKVVNGEVKKTVLSVHLTWTSRLEYEGFPRVKESADLFEWIKNTMLPDSQEWVDEDELKDIIENKN